MKKFMFLTLAALITSISVQAEIRQVKFKVKTRYYDENGKTRKLPITRAYVRYNSEASVFSNSSKNDCLVTSGKSDIFSLWTSVDKSECVSTKTFVVTTEDIITDMFYRPGIFSLFHNDINNVYNIIKNNGVITSKTEKDTGSTGTLRAVIRNLFGNATKTQTISLTGKTQFTLEGRGPAKFIIELTPVKTKVLNF